MMSDGSGRLSPGSSLTWDRPSSSWRTSPSLFDSGYLTSSPTLPTSGSMRNGVCSPRPPLAPLTNANASGFSLWPTTTTMDSVGSGGNPNTTGTHGTTLTDRAVRMWGTPVARDDQKSPDAHMAMKERMGRNTATSLTVQAKMWPTPRASMNENRTTGHAPSHGNGHGRTLAGEASEHGRHAPTTQTDGNSGSPREDLNPRFVAALMGVPWDWLTPSISVGTDSFHAWLQAHSVSSSIEPAVIEGAA
jgi:hypothetical protein